MYAASWCSAMLPGCGMTFRSLHATSGFLHALLKEKKKKKRNAQLPKYMRRLSIKKHSSLKGETEIVSETREIKINNMLHYLYEFRKVCNIKHITSIKITRSLYKTKHIFFIKIS